MHEIAYSLNRQFGNEQWCIYRGKHLFSFVDNHDVTRIASILENKNNLFPVYGLLFGNLEFPVFIMEVSGELQEKNVMATTHCVLQ